MMSRKTFEALRLSEPTECTAGGKRTKEGARRGEVRTDETRTLSGMKDRVERSRGMETLRTKISPTDPQAFRNYEGIETDVSRAQVSR